MLLYLVTFDLFFTLDPVAYFSCDPVVCVEVSLGTMFCAPAAGGVELFLVTLGDSFLLFKDCGAASNSDSLRAFSMSFCSLCDTVVL